MRAEAMQKELVQRYYTEHHKEKNRADFIYGGEDRAHLFQGWVGKGRTVLDLGCRDGALTGYYTEGNSIVGVDIDREALELCASRLGIKTLWHDINDGLPFGDGSFDIVVAGEVLEHIFYPEIVLREIARVLKTGGAFIGSVPNAFRLKNRLLFLFGKDFNDDKTHLHFFSYQGLYQLLSKYFINVEIFPIAGKFVRIHPRLFGLNLAWKCKKG